MQLTAATCLGGAWGAGARLQSSELHTAPVTPQGCSQEWGVCAGLARAVSMAAAWGGVGRGPGGQAGH